MNCHDSAQQYAHLGFAVLPVYGIRDGACTCRKHRRCPCPGKHPQTRNGLKDASINSKEIWGWWYERPGMNVGIRTGQGSGLVVLDIDPRHGGDEGLEHAQGRLGRLPPGPVAVTGSGGRHLLFAHPGQRIGSRIGVFRGVDIRGDGGYIVAPSSIHVSGGVYRWQSEPTTTLPALPAQWLDYLLWGKVDTEHSEHAEHARDLSLGKGGGTSEQAAIGRAIAESLPSAFGQRHRMIFELARRLKAIPTLADAPAVALKSYVRQWHAYAKHAIATKEWTESWADFVDAWPRVRHAKGEEPLMEVLHQATKNIPICAREYDNDQCQLLVSLCRILQFQAGRRPFFLSARTAGAMIGVSHESAARWMRMLVADEVLVLVTKGDRQSRKASEYTYEGD